MSQNFYDPAKQQAQRAAFGVLDLRERVKDLEERLDRIELLLRQLARHHGLETEVQTV